MQGLVEVLRQAGFKAQKPKGSFFLYVQAPESALGKGGSRVAFANAEAVSQWLITEKLISTVPWDDAGAYLRFSVTFIANSAAEEHGILQEIGHRLTSAKFEFA